jgi:predicted ferric reductase
MDRYPVRAGQFVIARFFDWSSPWNLWQAHPFSISKVPNGSSLRLTIKSLGDYTSRYIPRLKIGTWVVLDGPHGVFTSRFSRKQKVVLLAAGIGITPLRGLAEDLLKQGKDIILLYTNKTSQDILFKDEFAALSHSGLRSIDILTNEPAFEGEKGRIDEEKLHRLVPDLLSREVWICGPKQFIDSMMKLARKSGVSSNDIHFESFSLS